MKKEHQQEHKHKRYYVYRHKNGADIEYLHVSGSWVDDFYQADLEVSESLALHEAAKSKKFDQAGRNYCVGCVNVEVNGFYIGAEIK
jgi:hypothetical protein